MRQLFVGLAVLASAAGSPAAAVAQSILIVDLGAQAAGSSMTQSVTPGVYGIRIDNWIPTRTYSVSVLVRAVPIGSLPLAEINSTPTSCAALISLGEALKGTDETRVAAAVATALASIDTSTSCKEREKDIRARVAQSRYEWPVNIELAGGQELVVTVVRLASGKEEKRWTKTWTTGARGEWRATYGLASAFTRFGTKAGVFAKRTSVSIKTSGSEQIIEEHVDRAAGELLPAVLFHFMPAADQSARFVGGPMAGVSFDGTNPTLMGGYGWVYEQNISLSLGLMGRKEAILLSKYSKGDTVAASVTEDQLTGMHLRIRPFIALTFRLSANPFSSGGSPTEKAKAGTPP